jgi:hypothetical protein
MEEQRREEPPTTVKFLWTDFSRKNLMARIAELQRQDVRMTLEPNVRVIQFLREVSNRAALLLPALYAHIGSRSQPGKSESPYWKVVHSKATEHSSLLTMSLVCRAVFDDSSAALNGRVVANASDSVLAQVADHWSQSSGHPQQDAVKALRLLRQLFQLCAQQRKVLLKANSLLERRIGLVKYHADRQAAHITLEPYLFSPVDLIHVVAAITIIGAIIVEFDDKSRREGHFNHIDEGGWQAAKELFPLLPVRRLFDGVDIHQQARNCWRIEEFDGLAWILDQLSAAIGYWDSEEDTDATDPGPGRTT